MREFNFNEEIIDGHLVTAEVKKLWSIEIDMAQKLLNVCHQYGLKIWAEAGTLLGAVRHKGFIPWDDDMDFVMMRDDFEKLKEIGAEEFTYPYFFQTCETDDIESYVIRIRRSDTTFITTSDPLTTGRNLGIFIDVFVLDAIPDDEATFHKTYTKIKFMHRLMSNYQYYDTKSSTLKGRMSHTIIKTFFKFYSVKRMNRLVNNILARTHISENEEIDSIDFKAVLQWDILKILHRKKEWYSKTIFLPFHDISLPVPIGYHELLSIMYNNYMTPIKSSSIHTPKIIDCNQSYTKWLQKINN